MSTTPHNERRHAVAQTSEPTAVDLVSRRGFDAGWVDDVAATAMSSRTFFTYFGSQFDVLISYRRLDERLLQALCERPPDEGSIPALRRERAAAAAPALLARSRGKQLAGQSAITDAFAARMDAGYEDPRPRIVADASELLQSGFTELDEHRVRVDESV